MRRARLSQQFYNTLSTKTRVMLDATIFCLFAPFGFAVDIAALGSLSPTSLALMVLMSGGSAALYGRGGFTGKYIPYFTAGLLLQASVIGGLRVTRDGVTAPPALDAAQVEALRSRLELDAALMVLFIMAGYMLFLRLWNGEGSRFFARGTEIRLAQRIHQRLVPEVRGRMREAEWAGLSRPSGEIGGDLVDAIEGPAGMIGCVADVSGHGVGAGLLMGMFKTAFRAAAEVTSEPSEILARVHVTLAPLTEPNMYITAVVVRVDGRDLHVAGGGHPPLLLYRRATGAVEEIASTGPAIALLDDFNCRTVMTPLAPGDVALLLTDGITDALDRREQEVGLDAVSKTLAAGAAAPLDELLADVSALAAVVARADDQTLLAIRATAASS